MMDFVRMERPALSAENKAIQKPLSPEPPEALALDDYLAYLMARASFLVSQQFHKQIEQAGVSVPFWRVLLALSDNGELSVGELAKIVLYKQPTLTKIIDRMLELELVARLHSEQDRRRVEVKITQAGRDLVKDLMVAAKVHERQVLESYSAAEEATLKHMLRTLINRLDPM